MQPPTAVAVYLEVGNKRTFACAVDWPGWCRSGRDEGAALQTLRSYGPRYARVMQAAGLDFLPPAAASEFAVTGRNPGNATTDFGAPASIPPCDLSPLSTAELQRLRAILRACWQEFDRAVQSAGGKTLRKGPRGGGRNLEAMVRHVLEGDAGYLRRLAWKVSKDEREDIGRVRQSIMAALEAAAGGALPERGPRGGIIWPPRYFVRRVAWHTLDHLWEIEDRIVVAG
ncbi:MAG: hypothetical protein ACE5G8_01395 [Anaerolineae bacterium]